MKVSVSSTLLTVHEARLHATKRSEPRHSNSMVDQHFHSKLHVWLYRTYMLATERLTNRQQRRCKCPTRLSRMSTVCYRRESACMCRRVSSAVFLWRSRFTEVFFAHVSLSYSSGHSIEVLLHSVANISISCLWNF